MNLQESHEEHYERILPKSIFVISGSIISYLVLLVWVFFSVSDLKLFMFQSLAALIITIFTFIAGNTYRLSDIRKRQAYKLSQLSFDDAPQRQEAWGDIVPPSTIKFRFRLAFIGIALGALGQIAIIVFFAQTDDLVTGIVSALLVFVLTVFVFLAGTWTRPLD